MKKIINKREIDIKGKKFLICDNLPKKADIVICTDDSSCFYGEISTVGRDMKKNDMPSILLWKKLLNQL